MYVLQTTALMLRDSVELDSVKKMAVVPKVQLYIRTYIHSFILSYTDKTLTCYSGVSIRLQHNFEQRKRKFQYR